VQDVEQCGYLEKRTSSSSKKWQRRYFEIAGHYLRYFADDRGDLAKLKGGERKFCFKKNETRLDLKNAGAERRKRW
jgi:hypothetical protein